MVVYIYMSLPGGLVVKNLPVMQDVRDMGLTPGLGRSPGEGNTGLVTQPSILAGKNLKDRGAWQWFRRLQELDTT